MEHNLDSTFNKRWEFFYGKNNLSKILKALKEEDPRFIIPNSLKTNKNELKDILSKKGFEFSYVNDFDSLLVNYEPFNIVSTPEYLSGFFSIHALTSIIPPSNISLNPNNLIFDLAAAPGIKTGILAQKMGNKGTILAIEKSKARISALRANLSRLGVLNTIIIMFDSTRLPELKLMADHILLDAPCSGTGLKHTKNKRLRHRIKNDINRHASLQSKLLNKAWNQLKPGGTLIYSTCSLEPEEGEVQIDDFINHHENEVELLSLNCNIGQSGSKTNWIEPFRHNLKNTRRIFPGKGIDGFFVAALHKKVL
ncbi:MAG: RsmB/NOP family class I SAM-dependent RNA methyltransferase [Candidatus Hodarchaeales archaeon]